MHCTCGMQMQADDCTLSAAMQSGPGQLSWRYCTSQTPTLYLPEGSYDISHNTSSSSVPKAASAKNLVVATAAQIARSEFLESKLRKQSV